MGNLHSKRGLSLVELIVVIVFLVILIFTVTTVLFTAADTYHKTTANANAQQSCTLAESYIRRYGTLMTNLKKVSAADAANTAKQQKLTAGKACVRFYLQGVGTNSTLHIESCVATTGTVVWKNVAVVENVGYVRLRVEGRNGEDSHLQGTNDSAGTMTYKIQPARTEGYLYQAQKTTADSYEKSGGLRIENYEQAQQNGDGIISQNTVIMQTPKDDSYEGFNASNCAYLALPN